MEKDIKVLLEVDDMILAEEIQGILEKANIYSILSSDNPASSVMNIYSGMKAIENITLLVSINDYTEDVEIVNKTQYRELLADTE